MIAIQLPYIQPRRGITAQPAIDRPISRTKQKNPSTPSEYQWLGSKDPLELMCLLEDAGHSFFKHK